ncbi:hypothetical protein [Streptomyces sp. ICBB 8177]|uniref:hypothetical protein n=1 Tax=Streptomyces sp. ICBB 8177 TaxID=563922 RepID=UPI000D67493F|nr:hypothetical protein [Streptomyces sp. ICBB 8177]PWI41038.1 hypothetical protein CK485_27055 [Streptomyces sp. ICBB 8177]
MRTLMTVQIDSAAGSRAVESGAMQQTLEHLVQQIEPEAAFFSPVDGLRTAFFLFDLKDPSDLPRLVEPAFRDFNARVHLTPAMNLDDLRAGMQKLGKA